MVSCFFKCILRMGLLMFFSIIMPVYNGANTVSYAVDSVLSQSYKDFELIVVDDGSTDHTLELLKKYREADSRVRIITQSNQGVSAARNTGIDHAKGKYIGFIDADDLVTADAFFRIHQTAVTYDAEMIVGKYERMDGFSIYQSKRMNRMVSQLWIDKNDDNLVFCMSVYIKWFRKDIIDRYHVRFENYRYLEDAVFTYKFLQYVDRIYTCPYTIYRNLRPLFFLGTSVTRNIDQQLFDQAWPACSRILSLTEDYGDNFLSVLRFRMLHSIFGNVFYRKLWSVDPNSERKLFRYMETLYDELSEEWKKYYLASNADCIRGEKLMTKEDHLRSPIVCLVVLSMGKENIIPFLQCLYDQQEPSFIVYFDSALKKEVPQQYRKKKNLFFVKKSRISKKALAADARYITFIDQDICYEIRSVKDAIYYLERKEADSVYLPLIKIPDHLEDDRDVDMLAPSSISTVFFRTDLIKDRPEILEYIEGDDTSRLAAALQPDRLGKTCIIDNSNHMGEEYLSQIACRKMGFVKPEEVVDPKKQLKQFYLAQYLNLDIDDRLIAVYASQASEWLVSMIKGLFSYSEKGYKVVLIVPKDKYEESKDFVEERLESSRLVILAITGKRSAMRLFSAAFVVTESPLPYWWIKKPGQKLVFVNRDDRIEGEGGSPIDPNLQYLFMNMDASWFLSASYREWILKKYYMEKLCAAPELSVHFSDRKEDSGPSDFWKCLLERKWESDTPEDSGPVLYFSENLTNSKTLSLLQNAVEEAAFTEDDYLCLFNSELAKNEDGRKIPDSYRCILLKTIGFSARSARQAYLGDLEPRAIVLMDCANPYYLRCFLSFGEKVYWLLGEETVSLLLAGDSQMEKMIRSYNKSKHVMLAKDENTADQIGSILGCSIPVIDHLNDITFDS